jgi:acyl-coenzyme A synthetase/AMP-(fatty) acid ligase
VPTRVVEVAELPRNEVGKVLRHVLVERAAAADPPSPADDAP